MEGMLTHSTGLAGVVFAATLVPLLAAAACATPFTRRFAPALTAASALPALGVAAIAADSTATLSWLGTGAVVALEPTSRAFLIFTALVWTAAGAYAHATVRVRRTRFFGFFALAMAGNLALTVTVDPATFYTFFSLMALSTYALVAHPAEEARGRQAREGSPEAVPNPALLARRAGRVYLSWTVAGEAALLSGLIALAAGGAELVPMATALVLLAFGIKVGAPGLHSWMPVAYAAAPPAAAAALSGAMSTAGVLGVIRFVPGEGLSAGAGVTVIVLGLVAAFGGAAIGVVQRAPSAVLAYSSMSQFGLMTVAVGAGLTSSEAWPAAAFAVTVYAIHHGLAKAALFLGGDLATRAKRKGWVLAGLALPALALTGAPLTSGAVAKVALKDVTGGAPGAWPAVLEFALPLAAVGTTALVARFLYLVWAGRRPVAASVSLAHGLSRAGGVPLAATAWMALLIAVAAALWVWPAEKVAYAARTSLAAGYVWVATWPVLIGVALAAAARAGAPVTGRLAGAIPPGDVWAPLFSAAHTWIEQRDERAAAPSPASPATRPAAPPVTPRPSLATVLLNMIGQAEARLLVWAVAMASAGVLTLLVLVMAYAR